MKTVNCEGIEYLAHEAEGNAAQWIMPLAKHYCVGHGYDIGCNNDDWKMPGALGIDPAYSVVFHAMDLPDTYAFDGSNHKQADYIFSSHCLEHVKENWYNVLDYWLTKIRIGGILFLYLPHASQRYWQPRKNRKHIHSFTGDEIGEYLRSLGHQVFVSGVDMNHSFCVVCEKKEKVDSQGDVIMPGSFSVGIGMKDVKWHHSDDGSRIITSMDLTHASVKPFYHQNETEINKKIHEAVTKIINENRNNRTNF